MVKDKSILKNYTAVYITEQIIDYGKISISNKGLERESTYSFDKYLSEQTVFACASAPIFLYYLIHR